ncbi:GNAT family N-acetyltransferase [Fodinibius sp. Rm-B-1B1-1]|uniref:GNAT family N-acetyltransferase n=1 Tax=Fodinibius alkaliphilus TaxID=3140241 RepID=UPI00315B0C2C
MNSTLPEKLLSTSRYELRLARTESDMRAAQSLRYRVFNVELGEGLERSHEYELDIDRFDMQCDHLIVIEQQSGRVIGTYRLQTYQKAKEGYGLYTADEFDLSALPSDVLEDAVEVGRACIEKKHRNGRVLYLLWRGIAKYMEMTKSRYLLGCCSIKSIDPKEGWIVWDYLHHNDLINPSLQVTTKSDFACPEMERDTNAWHQVTLPELFELYIDIGATVLSKPALDCNFKTIDFLILVDIENLDDRSRSLFFR